MTSPASLEIHAIHVSEILIKISPSARTIILRGVSVIIIRLKKLKPPKERTVCHTYWWTCFWVFATLKAWVAVSCNG